MYMKSFTERVIEIVKDIKRGGVLSYGEVAKLAGSMGASRAVGSIMSHNDDISVPCHRVVRRDGSIGMYNGLRGEDKKKILKEEGVVFKGEKVAMTGKRV